MRLLAFKFCPIFSEKEAFILLHSCKVVSMVKPIWYGFLNYYSWNSCWELCSLPINSSFIFLFKFFFFFRAVPSVYGNSQARGRIGATTTGLCHSHSNAGSEPCLQTTPQLTATPDP